MSFSLDNLFRFTWRWLAGITWTPRRTLIVIAYFIVVPIVELIVWAGLLLDRLFFPGYRAQPVDTPLFIVGNFRSGTTFLHRLLAADRRRFTTMQMWEILFAPSITQRRIFGAFAALDRALGRPIPRLLRWIETRWSNSNVMHEVSLTQPEEDEYLCLHAWSALTIGLSSGLLEEARPYVRFDRDLSATDRDRIMRFYADCVRRHLWAHGTGGSQYLAKNPAACPKLDSLCEQFPDARFVYLVRNPLEAIPSFVSMMKFSWDVVGVRQEDAILNQFIIDMAGHWYRYPLERLARMPEDRYQLVVYDELVREPERVVRAIYTKFGYPIDENFADSLAAAQSAAEHYTSRHDYSLDELGINRDELVAEFADVFERFGFDT